MAVIIRGENILISDLTYSTDSIGGDRSKVAVKLSLNLNDGSVFTLFLVHWPSRRTYPAEATRRQHIAQSLRRSVDQIFSVDDLAHVIVLGDFNDDPFDSSICDYLMASRDLNLVKARPSLLYNPFWTEMVGNQRYTYSDTMQKTTGSHYYANGKVHRWHVFDQIVVSSAFVGRTNWHLNGESVQVINLESITGKPLGGDQHFDHYPVMAMVEKIEIDI